MLLLDEGTHGNGLGLTTRLSQRDTALLGGFPAAARRAHADIGHECVAFLTFRLNEDDIGALPGPYQVSIRSHIREFLTDLFDQVAVKVFPQPAGFDIGVHARKRGFQGLLLETLR